MEEQVNVPPPTKRARLAASAEEVEPVFFHCPHKDFYEDELTISNSSAVVDFTPGQGYLLHVAIAHDIPCIGFCMTAEHKVRLEIISSA